MTLVQIASNVVTAKLLNADRDTKLAISELLSYEVEGAEFSDAFKSSRWDGRSTFFAMRTGTFPAGFVPIVHRKLRNMGHRVQLARRKAPAPMGPDKPTVDSFGDDPRYDYQWATVQRLVKQRAMIAHLATGCHAKGTKVLMFDGTMKAVEDVKVGDQLMGPDSKPRQVLALHSGRDKMFRINPARGDSFVVNGGHILSLEQTKVGEGRKESIFNGRWVNISVDDYNLQSKTFRHIHKLHRSRGIDFDDETELPLDAYALGALLGDGYLRATSPTLTTNDMELVDWAHDFATSIDMFITDHKRESAHQLTFVNYRRGEAGGTGLAGRGIKNRLGETLVSLGLGGLKSGDKFVPHIYKTASRQDRAALLAGLMDTDGHLHNGGYDFISKSFDLARDVAFIARSLGLRAVATAKTYNSGRYAGNTYHRVSISGDCSLLPCKLTRKAGPLRLQDKDPCLTGFHVEPLGPGYYYGFEVDEDNLYLLEDFTITHNSGKSRVAKMAVAHIRRPTLFLTTRSILMYQMKEGFEEAGFRTGVLGDSEWSPKKGVNVGMVQTLAARLEEKTVETEIERYVANQAAREAEEIDKRKQALKKARKPISVIRSEIAALKKEQIARRVPDKEMAKTIEARVIKHTALREKTIRLLEYFQFIILEEAHEASSNSFYQVMKYARNAHYRLALTATPFMKADAEANMRLMACVGSVGIRISEKMLIDRGILATPYFKYAHAGNPPKLFRSTGWQRAYKLGIVENDHRNEAICQEAARAVAHGLTVMVLVQRSSHGERLKKQMSDFGLRVNFIYGKHDQERRKRALNKLGDGSLDVLIGSTILDVGVDVPAVGMIIMAGGGKAEVGTRQRIGRGLRAKKNGANVCYIVDFDDLANRHLSQHAQTRRAIVEATEGFVENILPSGEDFDFEGHGFEPVALAS